MHTISGISHLLLDIEGTTCPVTFVAETLFPYAAARLEAFLESQGHSPTVQPLLQAARQAWRDDGDPAAQALWDQQHDPEQSTTVQGISPYLRLLIAQDRKLSALKDLQGLIWEAGYGSGELCAPLFSDVPPSLRRWHQAGVVLAVYSSGSVAAQKLLYQHSDHGDLSGLFSHWFDTRHGPKQDARSYGRIAEAMAVATQHVLFISDAVAECEAARCSGMQCLFSRRAGNPLVDPGPFATISNYHNLQIQP